MNNNHYAILHNTETSDYKVVIQYPDDKPGDLETRNVGWTFVNTFPTSAQAEEHKHALLHPQGLK